MEQSTEGWMHRCMAKRQLKLPKRMERLTLKMTTSTNWLPELSFASCARFQKKYRHSVIILSKGEWNRRKSTGVQRKSARNSRSMWYLLKRIRKSVNQTAVDTTFENKRESQLFEGNFCCKCWPTLWPQVRSGWNSRGHLCSASGNGSHQQVNENGYLRYKAWVDAVRFQNCFLFGCRQERENENDCRGRTLCGEWRMLVLGLQRR